MSNSRAPSPLRAADYEAIEAALLETARGRWFLAEYANRNRSADTRMLLDAIARLEATMLQPRASSEQSHIQRDLIEMAEAISQTRREIAAMRAPDQDDSRFTNATEELDAIVEATEKATSDILEAAEDVQEIAWVLREKGADGTACDRLDTRATDIYTACSFQDLTGQRTGKVVQTLRFLENRVMSMIYIWGLDEIEVRNANAGDERPDAHLLNGPALNGEGVDQAEVDHMLGQHESGGPVIDGEAARAEDVGSFEAIPAGETAVPGPSQMQTAPQPLAGEVEASDFSAPPSLDIDELDETKTRVLFS